MICEILYFRSIFPHIVVQGVRREEEVDCFIASHFLPIEGELRQKCFFRGVKMCLWVQKFSQKFNKFIADLFTCTKNIVLYDNFVSISHQSARFPSKIHDCLLSIPFYFLKNFDKLWYFRDTEMSLSYITNIVKGSLFRLCKM